MSAIKEFAEKMKEEYDAARAAAMEKQITPEILEELRQEILSEAAVTPKLSAEEREAIKDQLILEMSGLQSGRLPSQELIAEEVLPAAQPITRVIEGIPHIQQADAEWGDMELGTPGSGETFRRKGCALSCLAILANYYLGKVSNGLIKPPLLNQFFVDNDGWFEQVNVVWGVLNSLFMRWGLEASVSQLRESEGATVEKIHQAVMQGIDARRPVLLRVRHGNIPHFLVAIGYKLDAHGQLIDIITHDPGTDKGDGYGEPPCSLYGNANHKFDLEGYIAYHVLGTPRHPSQAPS